MPLIGRHIRASIRQSLRFQMESSDFPVPVLYLKFGKNTGVIAKDSSPEGNDGTIDGASWTKGILGTGLSFDGIDNYVKVDDSASLRFPKGITIAICCKANREDIELSPFAKYDPPEGFIEFYYHPASGMRAEVSYIGTPLQVSIFDGITAIADLWRFYVLTYNNKILKIYTDGILRNSVAQIGEIPDITADLYIGQFERDLYVWSGVIDEIRIYDLAFTARQVLELYYGII